MSQPASISNSSEVVLAVSDLSVGFGSDGQTTIISEDVGFQIKRGEIYGLIGESGCGKTVTALAIMGLLPQPGGRILSGKVEFRGEDLLRADEQRLRQLRGRDLAMIFQEPAAALNPLLSIDKQLLEVFDYHDFEGDPRQRVRDMLGRVGIADPERILKAYPHELSGGMLQRVMISMALLLDPDLIVADEPTTALDVTVQAQIMELLLDLQRREGTAILMITHNMGLVAQYAQRVGVMYAGRLIEESPVAEFLERPLHPYSRGLMRAIPDLTAQNPRAIPIPGQVPKPADFPSGCRFEPRCPEAFAACQQRPVLRASGNARVACFLHHRPGENNGSNP